MSEMYASFKEINEVAQMIMGSFGRVTENYWGETTSPRDPTNMTLENYKSLSLGLGFKPAEQVLYSLDQAEILAESDSLGKLEFDTEIQSIIDALKKGNSAIESVGLFLSELLERFEKSEARLMSIYGYFGEVSDEDMRWIEDYLDPMGTSVQERGLFYVLTGDAEWSSLLANGKDGTVGIDACFIDETRTTTHRDETGRRVSDTSNQRLLCLTAKKGTKYSGGEKRGIEVGATVFSDSGGKSDTGALGVSKGEGLTIMQSLNEDGTSDITVGVPKVPVTLTVNTDRFNKAPEDVFLKMMTGESQGQPQQ